MQLYHRKSLPGVIVEAVMMTEENVDELANWAQAQVVQEGRVGDVMKEGLNIRTPNGRERLHIGMYLVKHAGRFYTAPATDFERQYVVHVKPSNPTPIHKDIRIDNPWEGIPRIKP